MTIEKTPIEGLLLFSPAVYNDERGYFFESFVQKEFDRATNGRYTFVQDNESKSMRGVIRGLHFQVPPYEQGKLVRVVAGKVQDVAVDLRKSSPTFGHSYSVVLSARNKKQLFVPPGFAHGFAVLEDHTIVAYKCTQYYHHQSEQGLYYADENLGINWLISDGILSDKDQKAGRIDTLESPF